MASFNVRFEKYQDAREASDRIQATLLSKGSMTLEEYYRICYKAELVWDTDDMPVIHRMQDDWILAMPQPGLRPIGGGVDG